MYHIVKSRTSIDCVTYNHTKLVGLINNKKIQMYLRNFDCPYLDKTWTSGS